jgi:hypothetical protein
VSVVGPTGRGPSGFSLDFDLWCDVTAAALADVGFWLKRLGAQWTRCAGWFGRLLVPYIVRSCACLCDARLLAGGVNIHRAATAHARVSPWLTQAPLFIILVCRVPLEKQHQGFRVTAGNAINSVHPEQPRVRPITHPLLLSRVSSTSRARCQGSWLCVSMPQPQHRPLGRTMIWQTPGASCG